MEYYYATVVAIFLLFASVAATLIALAILYALHVTKAGRQPAAQALDSLPIMRGTDA